MRSQGICKCGLRRPWASLTKIISSQYTMSTIKYIILLSFDMTLTAQKTKKLRGDAQTQRQPHFLKNYEGT
jgi:hypothetical protein